MVPFIMEMVRPESVVDVGCGVGTWLGVFRELGVQTILGMDGDYVQRELLEIPSKSFLPVDLSTRVDVGRRFDLVVSLEVAEHLEQRHAERFVETLTSLGTVVLFSAAIPFQGGEHHVNEQWPDYWAEKFMQQGYTVVDCIRPRFWSSPDVCWWYAQNMFFFVREDELEDGSPLCKEIQEGCDRPLSIVHPRKYMECLEHANTNIAKLELRQIIPAGATWVLVDDGKIGPDGWGDYHVHSFLERGGEFWGAPTDSAAAIQELNGAIEGGASFIAITWQAFWWLEHYSDFRRFLDSNFIRLLENNRLIICQRREVART